MEEDESQIDDLGVDAVPKQTTDNVNQEDDEFERRMRALPSMPRIPKLKSSQTNDQSTSDSMAHKSVLECADRGESRGVGIQARWPKSSAQYEDNPSSGKTDFRGRDAKNGSERSGKEHSRGGSSVKSKSNSSDASSSGYSRAKSFKDGQDSRLNSRDIGDKRNEKRSRNNSKNDLRSSSSPRLDSSGDEARRGDVGDARYKRSDLSSRRRDSPEEIHEKRTNFDERTSKRSRHEADSRSLDRGRDSRESSQKKDRSPISPKRDSRKFLRDGNSDNLAKERGGDSEKRSKGRESDFEENSFEAKKYSEVGSQKSDRSSKEDDRKVDSNRIHDRVSPMDTPLSGDKIVGANHSQSVSGSVVSRVLSDIKLDKQKTEAERSGKSKRRKWDVVEPSSETLSKSDVPLVSTGVNTQASLTNIATISASATSLPGSHTLSLSPASSSFTIDATEEFNKRQFDAEWQGLHEGGASPFPVFPTFVSNSSNIAAMRNTSGASAAGSRDDSPDTSVGRFGSTVSSTSAVHYSATNVVASSSLAQVDIVDREVVDMDVSSMSSNELDGTSPITGTGAAAGAKPTSGGKNKAGTGGVQEFEGDTRAERISKRKVVTFNCPDDNEVDEKKRKIIAGRFKSEKVVVKKADAQEVVVAELKEYLRPLYLKRRLSKDEYKEVMRRAVPKIIHGKRNDLSQARIHSYASGYVKKILAKRKSNIKDEELESPDIPPPPPPPTQSSPRDSAPPPPPASLIHGVPPPPPPVVRPSVVLPYPGLLGFTAHPPPLVGNIGLPAAHPYFVTPPPPSTAAVPLPPGHHPASVTVQATSHGNIYIAANEGQPMHNQMFTNQGLQLYPGLVNQGLVNQNLISQRVVNPDFSAQKYSHQGIINQGFTEPGSVNEASINQRCSSDKPGSDSIAVVTSSDSTSKAEAARSLTSSSSKPRHDRGRQDSTHETDTSRSSRSADRRQDRSRRADESSRTKGQGRAESSRTRTSPTHGESSRTRTSPTRDESSRTRTSPSRAESSKTRTSPSRTKLSRSKTSPSGESSRTKTSPTRTEPSRTSSSQAKLSRTRNSSRDAESSKTSPSDPEPSRKSSRIRTSPARDETSRTRTRDRDEFDPSSHCRLSRDDHRKRKSSDEATQHEQSSNRSCARSLGELPDTVSSASVIAEGAETAASSASVGAEGAETAASSASVGVTLADTAADLKNMEAERVSLAAAIVAAAATSAATAAATSAATAAVANDKDKPNTVLESSGSWHTLVSSTSESISQTGVNAGATEAAGESLSEGGVVKSLHDSASFPVTSATSTDELSQILARKKNEEADTLVGVACGHQSTAGNAADLRLAGSRKEEVTKCSTPGVESSADLSREGGNKSTPDLEAAGVILALEKSSEHRSECGSGLLDNRASVSLQESTTHSLALSTRTSDFTESGAFNDNGSTARARSGEADNSVRSSDAMNAGKSRSYEGFSKAKSRFSDVGNSVESTSDRSGRAVAKSRSAVSLSGSRSAVSSSRLHSAVSSSRSRSAVSSSRSRSPQTPDDVEVNPIVIDDSPTLQYHAMTHPPLPSHPPPIVIDDDPPAPTTCPPAMDISLIPFPFADIPLPPPPVVSSSLTGDEASGDMVKPSNLSVLDKEKLTSSQSNVSSILSTNEHQHSTDSTNGMHSSNDSTNEISIYAGSSNQSLLTSELSNEKHLHNDSDKWNRIATDLSNEKYSHTNSSNEKGHATENSSKKLTNQKDHRTESTNEPRAFTSQLVASLKETVSPTKSVESTGQVKSFGISFSIQKRVGLASKSATQVASNAFGDSVPDKRPLKSLSETLLSDDEGVRSDHAVGFSGKPSGTVSSNEQPVPSGDKCDTNAPVIPGQNELDCILDDNVNKSSASAGTASACTASASTASASTASASTANASTASACTASASTASASTASASTADSNNASDTKLMTAQTTSHCSEQLPVESITVSCTDVISYRVGDCATSGVAEVDKQTSHLPTDSSSHLPSDSSSNLPSDSSSNLPTDSSSHPPTDSSSHLPTDSSSHLPTDSSTGSDDRRLGTESGHQVAAPAESVGLTDYAVDTLHSPGGATQQSSCNESNDSSDSDHAQSV